MLELRAIPLTIEPLLIHPSGGPSLWRQKSGHVEDPLVIHYSGTLQIVVNPLTAVKQVAYMRESEEGEQEYATLGELSFASRRDEAYFFHQSMCLLVWWQLVPPGRQKIAALSVLAYPDMEQARMATLQESREQLETLLPKSGGFGSWKRVRRARLQSIKTN